MKRKVTLSLGMVVTALLLRVPLGAHGSEPEPSWGLGDGVGIHLRSSTTEAIVLDVVTPRPDVTAVRVGEEMYDQVEMDGFATAAQPGMPELPVQGVMLGIPPGVTWQIELVSTDRVVMKGPYRVIPGASLEPELASQTPGIIASVTEERVPDPRTYGTPVFFPTEVAEAGDSGYLRDQRFVTLRIYPVRYNPVTGELEWYRRIRLRLRFEGQSPEQMWDGEQDGFFEPVLQAAILNYQQAKGWRSREPSGVPATTAPICGTGPQYKVIVGADGMHQITYADLSGAGFPVGAVDPKKLTMCYMGQEVAIQVLGEQDGVFDPTDRILFYGIVPYSRYSGTSTYWLSFGSADGKRMGDQSGAVEPATPYVPSHAVMATAEESHYYDSLYPTPKGDHWFWDDLQWLDIPPYTANYYMMQLDHPPAGVGAAIVEIGLQGYTANLHQLKFSLNGTFLGTHTWAGQTYKTVSVEIPMTVLRQGENTLIAASADKGAIPDGVWLDMVSVQYRAQNVALDGKSLTFTGQSGPARYWVTGFSDPSAQVYDVTDVWNVARLTGVASALVYTTRLPAATRDHLAGASVAEAPGEGVRTAAAEGYGLAFQGDEVGTPVYWTGTEASLQQPVRIEQDALTNWRSPANGADYLVITDPSLAAQANRLVLYHQGEGLQALSVFVQDIYDEFNFGQADPEAIREFLRYAYDVWSLRPSYVLFLGDGNFDFRDYYGYGQTQLVPPLLAMVDGTMGETATDHRYAAVHGSDILPDMYVGRLPAADLAQAQVMVDKTLEYATEPVPGDWSRRVVLVSDNVFDESDVRVEVDDFIGSSESILSTYVLPPYVGQRIYLDPSPSGAGLPGRYSDASAAHAAILSAFDQGALLWDFMGHSSDHQWAAERVFHIDDVSGLTNGSRLPVLLEMTCQTGQFHIPRPEATLDALDEQLIRLPTGGTVASWSPTGWGLARGHDIMQQAFYEEVFANGHRQLGPAIAVGTIHAHTAGYLDLVDTFLLFGDPALFLR